MQHNTISINDPRMARVGAARMAQNTHRPSSFCCLKSILLLFIGIKRRKCIYIYIYIACSIPGIAFILSLSIPVGRTKWFRSHRSRLFSYQLEQIMCKKMVYTRVRTRGLSPLNPFTLPTVKYKKRKNPV